MPNIGPMEILLLGVLALLLFGPSKLPEIGRQLGRGMRDFKDAIDGTGVKDALDGVNEVRTAVSPTNMARALVPGVADAQDAVADAKGAVADAKSAVSPVPPSAEGASEGEAQAKPDKPVKPAEPAA